MSQYDEREYHHHTGQGMPDGERIAILEANERNMSRRLEAMDRKLDKVVNTLAEISGGKKAFIALYGLIGGAIASFATLFGLHLFGK
jgi:tetrahydromethanopterin S-methyltransferase subunit G